MSQPNQLNNKAQTFINTFITQGMSGDNGWISLCEEQYGPLILNNIVCGRIPPQISLHILEKLSTTDQQRIVALFSQVPKDLLALTIVFLLSNSSTRLNSPIITALMPLADQTCLWNLILDSFMSDPNMKEHLRHVYLTFKPELSEEFVTQFCKRYQLTNMHQFISKLPSDE